ncbi:T9SS type A sorting domain-containing protein [Flavobacterium restrictum]|nr:T9SS type A sorting domain-containing protein [Flavobacterium restrictum]
MLLFTGGCSINSPVNSYTVFSNANPPVPNGYIVSTPDDGNICTATSFTLDFVGQNVSYWHVNISPRIIFATGVKPKQKIVQVCYSNPFTGIKTCQSYGYLAPAPCLNSRLSSNDITAKITITPNPTNGYINVILPETLSGNYQIYDQNSILVEENKFDNRYELQIELANKIKSGIYILKVITENITFTEKIILDK